MQTKKNIIGKKSIRNILQALSWIAGIACLVYAVSFLVRRSYDIMKTNSESGYIARPAPEIKDGVMTPEILLSFGKVSDPQISPDGEYILYNVSYTSVEENRSCSNLYICRTDGSSRQQLTASGESIGNARWCGGGRKLLYLRNGQLWSADIRHTSRNGWVLRREEQISDIPAGISEFKLSPDESMLMYTSRVKSSINSPKDIYPDLGKAGAIVADDLMYRHWDHWVTDIPHTFISEINVFSSKPKSIRPENSTDILSAEKELYELPAEPFSGIEQLSWSPDGRTIAYSCKKLTGKKYAFSTNSEIYFYDVATGECTQVVRGGGYDTCPVWSPDGSMICWLSMERDGYEADKQRLLVAEVGWKSPAGEPERRLPVLGNVTDVTEDFKYNASAPVWDPSSGTIYFNALAEGVQGIFAADIAGDGTIRRITGEDLWFDFSSPFGIVHKDGRTSLLTSWCSMDFPSELVAVDAVADTVSIRPITSENAYILDNLAKTRTEARHIRTVDGKDMLTWVIYPPEFDEDKVYPSILICLGGPQGTLSQGWSYRWNYRLMASQGYVVVLPNRRGTTAFGQEWTEQISGDYCGLNIQDYISAAKALKSEKYIGKMAACGASYGGYSVYYLCGVHGDVFDAFIAHAGIFNEEHMYMTTEEMWFPNWDNGGLHEAGFDPSVGTSDAPCGPAGDGETFGGIRQGGSPWSTSPLARRHYANSPHKFVTAWHTPLLVTHGGMDFRVPADEGMAAYNAAQMMGVPSRLIIFPDENHWILKPQNALFWHREYFSWLDKWCK